MIVLAGERRVAIQDAILRLVASTGKWESLPRLISAAADRDAHVATVSQELVRRWMGNTRVFTHPSDAQRRELRQAWSRSEQGLPVEFADEIRRWLQSLAVR